MTRGRLSLWVVVLLGFSGSCSESHLADLCDRDEDCSEGMVCDFRREAVPRQCVPACDTGEFLCDDGAACIFGRCTAGGTDAEGTVTSAEPTGCGFGLRPASDYTAEPLVARCYPACDEPDDCGDDERCHSHSCRRLCEGADATPCSGDATCGFGVFCVSPRRFGRSDCDGNGMLINDSGDCLPEFACDATAIGGCAHVPLEER